MDAIDRFPQGEPETIAEWPDRRLFGLHVRGADGASLGMLEIRCARGPNDTNLPIGLKVLIGTADVIEPSQRNPNRIRPHDHGYGYVEDDGA